jgi:hypothetical protein
MTWVSFLSILLSIAMLYLLGNTLNRAGQGLVQQRCVLDLFYSGILDQWLRSCEPFLLLHHYLRQNFSGQTEGGRSGRAKAIQHNERASSNYVLELIRYNWLRDSNLRSDAGKMTLKIAIKQMHTITES